MYTIAQDENDPYGTAIIHLTEGGRTRPVFRIEEIDPVGDDHTVPVEEVAKAVCDHLNAKRDGATD